jgi:transcription elongation GreA/GreB family factor
VTEAGRAAIENALHRFEAAHKAAIEKEDQQAVAADVREIRYWKARLASARIVEPSAGTGRVQFGATITISSGTTVASKYFKSWDGTKPIPRGGTVSHVSPRVRAMMGRAVGDDAFDLPGGVATVLMIQ